MIILPNVVIGRGAVVAAGSVVTRSVPPMTVVQGNPAVPVAQCGVPLGPDVTQKEFSRRLKPLTVRAQDQSGRLKLVQERARRKNRFDMKLVVPHTGEVQAADARLIRLAEFLGMRCEPLRLDKQVQRGRSISKEQFRTRIPAWS